MVGAEGLKIFQFNNSILLEKALKSLPSHFKFRQTFAFLLSIFWGTRVWALILHLQYENPTGYIAAQQQLKLL